MDLLDRMLGHDHWATTRILEYSKDLTDVQLDQEFDIGHTTLRQTLRHQIFAINFWTVQMLGQPLGEEREDRSSIAELTGYHERFQATFAELARRMRDEQRLDDTFVDHFGNLQTQGGTVIHVMYHSAQHRADARHMLERLAVPDVWDLDPQEWEYVQRDAQSQEASRRRETTCSRRFTTSAQPGRRCWPRSARSIWRSQARWVTGPSRT
jgi:uncharacterized damage-inducible protein DinB